MVDAIQTLKNKQRVVEEQLDGLEMAYQEDQKHQEDVHAFIGQSNDLLGLFYEGFQGEDFNRFCEEKQDGLHQMMQDALSYQEEAEKQYLSDKKKLHLKADDITQEMGDLWKEEGSDGIDL